MPLPHRYLPIISDKKGVASLDCDIETLFGNHNGVKETTRSDALVQHMTR